jgi:hypothetical protein
VSDGNDDGDGTITCGLESDAIFLASLVVVVVRLKCVIGVIIGVAMDAYEGVVEGVGREGVGVGGNECVEVDSLMSQTLLCNVGIRDERVVHCFSSID